ncbi:MAG: hypothetical protein QNK04_04140 [Myxococcota bacterium]|nr:hypothetical protein [Myxococcota bacterium]
MGRPTAVRRARDVRAGDRYAAEGLPGLQAARRTTPGIAAQGYSSGLSIADAAFFGRRAGRSAAQSEDRSP